MASLKTIQPLEQPEGGETRSGKSLPQVTTVKKGSYDLLKTEAHDLEPVFSDPTSPSGKSRVVTWNLARLPGDLGKLTITTQQLGKKEDVPGSETAEEDTVSYSIRNVQTSLPLTRYCGPSEAANAYAVDIQNWREESDRTLYDSYGYRRPDGGTVFLSEASRKLADKYKIGIESVMRFYPVVTKTTTYVAGSSVEAISGLGEKLAYIDTPPKMSSLAPAWLKIQDEATIDGNGIITRTEGWQGAEAFDENLYGADGQGGAGPRWKFGTI